jgi:hypothetical protein
VAVDENRDGWWRASDGNLYPPELHPDYQTTTYQAPAVPRPAEEVTRQSIGPNSTFKRLPYGGTCIGCGSTIPKGASGWHDASISKVACSNCPPDDAWPAQPKSTSQVLRTNPAGGTSALGIANTRRDSKWIKGAAGEYLMAKALHEGLKSGEVILNDRTIPQSKANIDHIVIASSGIWIIDSKHWKGQIQVKNVGGIMHSTQKLFVDGRDESYRAERMYSQVIPIANTVNDPSVPIRPVLVFIDGNWGAGTTLRILRHRPYEMLGVLISWPRAVIARIAEPGPISPEGVVRLAQVLDRVLPPAV